jgi:hypothetical protein
MTTSRDRDDDRTHLAPRRIPEEAPARADADFDEVATQIVDKRSNNPVARLVVVEGPGIGNAKPIYPGTNAIGRDRKNRISLDFGDATISRSGHAVIVVDPATRHIAIIDGGKLNPVSVNSVVLTGERTIGIGDIIELGSTILRLEAI